jgi:Tol biopolymer transport system component
MDVSGKVLARSLVKGEFLAGWSADSKAVVCFRDGRYAIVTPGGASIEAGETRHGAEQFAPERVVFLNDLRRPAWLDLQERPAVLRTSAETLPHPDGLATFEGTQLMAPSPDGRYIAMASENVWTWDRLLRQASKPVNATISPDSNWQYMQPAWDPWFADSTRLVFFSGRDLVISSADGKTKRVVITVDQPSGLAVPSPDGASIAYVSFRPIALEGRPDIKFWGNTAVWVVAADGRRAPRQLAAEDSDTTSGLRWLGNDSLVFDRIGQNLIRDMHARIWEVAVR